MLDCGGSKGTSRNQKPIRSYVTKTVTVFGMAPSVRVGARAEPGARPHGAVQGRVGADALQGTGR